MVLSKSDIQSRMSKKEIVFKPQVDGFQVQPHAIDLRLGFEFHIPKTWEVSKEGRKAITIDPLDMEANGKSFEKIKLKPGQFFELLPQESIIGVTLEKIELNADDLMCVLYPRSSINRRGLSVALSGIIDVGYQGHLMIPIVNKTDQQLIRIYPGERVCQVVFQQLSSGVSSEDASIHGLTSAKYNKSDSAFTNSKSDRTDEIDLIRNGEIDKLKKKYAVNVD